MKYVTFVGTDGPQSAENVAEMNRDCPAYAKEVELRDVRVCGRELDFPPTAVTVRMRAGDALVTDGPFTETKEFVGGIAVVECADLDEVIDIEGRNPVARFLPFEIRPVRGEMRLGSGVEAFERGDDSGGIPYLLMVWVDPKSSGLEDEQAMLDEAKAWRETQAAGGSLVLGSALGGPETATTMRFRDGRIQVSDGSFLDIDAFISGIDVVTCTSRQEAVELAAGHPSASHHAIEVRPFYSEAAQSQAESPA